MSDTVASPIWRLWQEGSRHEWAWPCPQCKHYFIPRFKQLWWPEKSSPDEARTHAKLKCPSCDFLIDDPQKPNLNANGRFVAPGQSINSEGEIFGEADTIASDCASFWVSGICSFSPKKTFGFLAKKFLAAVRSGEPERIQGVINTDFGECFKVGGDAPEWSTVLDRKRGYQQGQIPEGVNVLTAGIDVQKNRLVYVIRGWGKHYESWLIEYGELWGETDQPPVWQSLSELIARQWQGLSLSRVAIDSGYQTQAVYQFCRQHKHIALATKGHDTLDKPFKKSDIDVNVRGKIVKHSLRLWHFNTDQMKSWVHSRIEWPCDQAGGWWLPQDISDDYCKQLVAKQRSVKPSGKVVWVKVKQHNHFLDAESLAYLAVRIVSSGREFVVEGQSVEVLRPKRRVISRGVCDKIEF